MTPPPFLKLTFGRGGIRPLPLLRPRAVPGEEEPLPPAPARTSRSEFRGVNSPPPLCQQTTLEHAAALSFNARC